MEVPDPEAIEAATILVNMSYAPYMSIDADRMDIDTPATRTTRKPTRDNLRVRSITAQTTAAAIPKSAAPKFSTAYGALSANAQVETATATYNPFHNRRSARSARNASTANWRAEVARASYDPYHNSMARASSGQDFRAFSEAEFAPRTRMVRDLEDQGEDGEEI